LRGEATLHGHEESLIEQSFVIRIHPRLIIGVLFPVGRAIKIVRNTVILFTEKLRRDVIRVISCAFYFSPPQPPIVKTLIIVISRLLKDLLG
jgi:hypothetical protein